MLGNGMIMPIVGPLVLNDNFIEASASLAYRNLIYGLIIFLPAITLFIAMPIIASLSDFTGTKKWLYRCLFLQAVSYFLTIYALDINELYLFLFARFIGGVGVASVSLAQVEIVNAEPENKVKNLSVMIMYAVIGNIAGGITSGIFNNQISHYLTLNTPFIVGGLLTLINLILVYFTSEAFPKQVKETRQSVLSHLINSFNVFSTSQIIWCCFIFLLFSVAYSMQLQYVAFYLSYTYHYNQLTLSILTVFSGCLSFVGLFLLSKTSLQFLPALWLLALSLCLIFCSALCLSLQEQWLVWLAVLPLSIGVIMGQAVFLAYISSLVPTDHQGKISAVLNCISPLSACLSIMLATGLGLLSILLPFICSALIAMMTSVALLVYKKQFTGIETC